MSFCVNEFEVGVNDSIFPGNEQQKVYKENSDKKTIQLTINNKYLNPCWCRKSNEYAR